MMDRRQFTANVEATQEALRRFLVALCCGDSQLADDIAQEAYVKAYISVEGLREDGNFKSWIFRIAYNTFLNHKRSEKRMDDYEEAKSVLSPESADYAFRYQALYAALDLLPDKERTSVLLYYMEGYSVKDVSEIVGASEAAVRQHLTRGRNHLRGLLSNSN